MNPLELLNIGKSIIDKIIPDASKRAEMKLELERLHQQGDLKELEVRMSAILEEAKSADKWTSRARPSFLYVMYTMILASLPMGVLYAVYPLVATAISTGMKEWLAAIPDPLWALFGAGYLGYSAVRSVDKAKRLKVK